MAPTSGISRSKPENIFSPETCLIRIGRLSVRNTSIPLGNRSRQLQEAWVCHSRGTQPQWARQACRSLVNRNHHLHSPRRYTPFKADEIKDVIQQTMEVRVKFRDGYWNDVSDEGSGTLTTTKSFIRTLLTPNPTRRLASEKTLSESYTWPTSIALRPNMTSTVCARTLTRPHVGTPPSAPRVLIAVREK